MGPFHRALHVTELEREESVNRSWRRERTKGNQPDRRTVTLVREHASNAEPRGIPQCVDVRAHSFDENDEVMLDAIAP